MLENYMKNYEIRNALQLRRHTIYSGQLTVYNRASFLQRTSCKLDNNATAQCSPTNLLGNFTGILPVYSKEVISTGEPYSMITKPVHFKKNCTSVLIAAIATKKCRIKSGM